MSQDSRQPDGLNRLKNHLIRVAERRSLAMEEDPRGLHVDRLPLESAPDRAHDAPDSEHLLAVLVIDGYTTLIGSLEQTEDESSRDQAMDEYHWRASTVRGWLSPNRKDDLMLCLACPAGSDEDDEWLSTRAEIEGDDRVCRKLLWLPPSSVDTAESSLDRLIARSFLAKPWEAEHSAATENLDPWQRLEQQMEAATGMQDGDVARLRAWKDLLIATADSQGQLIVPGRDLVEKLLAHLESDPAS